MFQNIVSLYNLLQLAIPVQQQHGHEKYKKNPVNELTFYVTSMTTT